MLAWIKPFEWRTWAIRTLHHALPPLCWGCEGLIPLADKSVPAYPWLCQECWPKLPWMEFLQPCSGCGHPLSESSVPFCGICAHGAFEFERVHAALVYEEQPQDWIVRFKFGHQTQLAPLLGRLLALSLKPVIHDFQADALVPIPLHPSRLRERGFNQALLLAHYSLKSFLPLHPSWLQRVRATDPQTELEAKARARNVRDAFQATEAVAGQKIILLDDVMTTGATLNAATRALKQAGACSVKVWVLARKVL